MTILLIFKFELLFLSSKKLYWYVEIVFLVENKICGLGNQTCFTENQVLKRIRPGRVENLFELLSTARKIE